MIVDSHGRRFRNLRVSLTAACNYACTYCVADGKRLQPASRELSAEALVKAVRLMIRAAGIEKLRITGGEPLLSSKFDEFLPAVMALPLSDVAVTTNGQFLARKADIIGQAGLRRVNVSLDTLEPDRFRSIARSGDLETVLAGIDAMIDLGLKVKINMVPMRTANADQILPMLEFCLDRGIELRYIELMNMGHLKYNAAYQRDFIGMDELLNTIGDRFTFARTDAPYDSTSVRFNVPGLRQLRHHRQRERTVLQFLHAPAAVVQRTPLRMPVQHQSSRHQRPARSSGARSAGCGCRVCS